MQVNFTGEKDYMSAGPGYAQKSGTGKKVAAGVVLTAGLAAVGLAAHKGGVFAAVKDQFTKAKDVEGFGKKFTTIFSKEHIVKGFKGIGEGFTAIGKSIAETFGKVRKAIVDKLPKAKEEVEEVVEEVVE